MSFSSQVTRHTHTHKVISFFPSPFSPPFLAPVDQTTEASWWGNIGLRNYGQASHAGRLCSGIGLCSIHIQYRSASGPLLAPRPEGRATRDTWRRVIGLKKSPGQRQGQRSTRGTRPGLRPSAEAWSSGNSVFGVDTCGFFSSSFFLRGWERGRGGDTDVQT